MPEPCVGCGHPTDHTAQANASKTVHICPACRTAAQRDILDRAQQPPALDRDDQGVSAVIGILMMTALTVTMAAAAMPALLDWADSSRDLARAQAQMNRETIRCVETASACPTNGTVVVCDEKTNLNGTTRTVCWTTDQNPNHIDKNTTERDS